MVCDKCGTEIEYSEANRVTKGCCHEKVEYYYCDACYKLL